VNVFGKIYEWTPENPFENYEEIRQRKEFYVTENFYLPFAAEFIWYLEYTPQTEFYTEAEIKELAEKRFLNKYKNILQKGVQIIEKNVKIDTNDKLCIVGGYVRMRIPVTTKVPAIIPDHPMGASGEGEN
jgi:similar to stage IV sporulation protein